MLHGMYLAPKCQCSSVAMPTTSCLSLMIYKSMKACVARQRLRSGDLSVSLDRHSALRVTMSMKPLKFKPFSVPVLTVLFKSGGPLCCSSLSRVSQKMPFERVDTGFFFLLFHKGYSPGAAACSTASNLSRG